MCENITNKNLDIQNVTLLRNKFQTNIDNPPISINKILIPSKNINLNVIQDGLLMVGTKQRVVTLFLKSIIKKNKLIDTILYAGSLNGFGALAAAYGSKKLGITSMSFLTINSDHIDNKIYHTRQITTLQALNSQIYLCKNWNDTRLLEYKTSEDKNGKRLPNCYICPMGFNDEEGIMINLLAKQIKKATKNTILKNDESTRIWLVSGSGGIAMSINKALPKAKLFIKLTGGHKFKKNIVEWAKNKKNVLLIKDDPKLENNNDSQLYYSSTKNYDDLIFPYVKKYGKNNDFIWNVGSDDFL